MVGYRDVVAGVLVALASALGSGCATMIVPPAAPSRPVTVYVSDYGRHSSLLLPTSGGELMEYSFGDWDYYALKKYRWYIGATALLVSDGSGLGRRVLPHPGTCDALREYLKSDRVLAVEVEQARVAELLGELELRFAKNIGSMVYNDWYNQYIVRDEARYGLFNTCNGMTATWLEQLGCEVLGVAVLSNFEIADEKGATTQAASRPSGKNVTTQATSRATRRAATTRGSRRGATTQGRTSWDPSGRRGGLRS